MLDDEADGAAKTPGMDAGGPLGAHAAADEDGSQDPHVFHLWGCHCCAVALFGFHCRSMTAAPEAASAPVGRALRMVAADGIRW